MIIINQYDRAVVLRIGVYKRPIRIRIHTRIPLIDNVLVIDIREKVRESNGEGTLTKDNVYVIIDAILRYKIIDDRANDALLNVENLNEVIKQVSQTTLRNNIGFSCFKKYFQRWRKSNVTSSS